VNLRSPDGARIPAMAEIGMTLFRRYQGHMLPGRRRTLRPDRQARKKAGCSERREVNGGAAQPRQRCGYDGGSSDLLQLRACSNWRVKGSTLVIACRRARRCRRSESRAGSGSEPEQRQSLSLDVVSRTNGSAAATNARWRAGEEILVSVNALREKMLRASARAPAAAL